MGDNVNLAARLMGLAGPDEVLVDESTMRQAEDRLDFEVFLTRP